MLDEILEIRNQTVVDLKRPPRYILFSRISYGMFLSELDNGEAFKVVHTGEFMGMIVTIVQKQTGVFEFKDFFEVK